MTDRPEALERDLQEIIGIAELGDYITVQRVNKDGSHTSLVSGPAIVGPPAIMGPTPAVGIDLLCGSVHLLRSEWKTVWGEIDKLTIERKGRIYATLVVNYRDGGPVHWFLRRTPTEVYPPKEEVDGSTTFCRGV